MRIHAIGLSLILLGLNSVNAADWPQWLGPKRDNTSTETVPIFKDLKPLWTQPVGEGNSSPIVADGLVFLHTKVKDKDQESVQAYDVKSGEKKWEQKYDKAPFKPKFGEGPRATPLYDGKNLYTFGNTGVLTCWEAKTGKQIWQVDTLKVYSAPNIMFGITASPLLVDDLVIVMVGNAGDKPSGSNLVAFDKSTGKEIWKSQDDLASYASPVLLDKQIVALTGAHLLAVKPKDGALLWKEPFKDLLLESSTTPVKIGDLYLASSITAGTIGLQVADGKVKKVWSDPKLTGYFSTPVPIDDRHALLVTGKLIPPNFASIHCIDVTNGKILWTKERIGKYHASIMKLKDNRFLMLDDSGNLILLENNVKEYQELARTSLFKANGDAWAHPALVDGVFYIRDNRSLMAFKLN